MPDLPATLPPLHYIKTPNQSFRGPGTAVRLIVVHRWGVTATPDERRTYQGVIRHLCNPAAKASAHIVYAGGEERDATQLVPWAKKAWACVHYNSASDNIETPDDLWAGEDDHGLWVAARIVAQRCHARGIPPVWIQVTGVDGSQAGVTRHYDLGAAGGGHTDPTTDSALWREFMRRVKIEHTRGGLPDRWGI